MKVDCLTWCNTCSPSVWRTDSSLCKQEKRVTAASAHHFHTVQQSSDYQGIASPCARTQNCDHRDHHNVATKENDLGKCSGFPLNFTSPLTIVQLAKQMELATSKWRILEQGLTVKSACGPGEVCHLGPCLLHAIMAKVWHSPKRLMHAPGSIVAFGTVNDS